MIRHRVDSPSARRRHTALRLRTDSSSTGAMGPTAAHRPTWCHISAYHRSTKDSRARHPNDRAPKQLHRRRLVQARWATRPAALTRRAFTVYPARIRVHEPAQPSHLPHRDAAAAPVGGLATRQTLVDGHRQQRAATALLRVPDGAPSRSPSAVNTSTTHASSRRSRSVRSLRSTAWASKAERRAAASPTADSSPSPDRHRSFLSPKPPPTSPRPH